MQVRGPSALWSRQAWETGRLAGVGAAVDVGGGSGGAVCGRTQERGLASNDMRAERTAAGGTGGRRGLCGRP